MPILTVQKNKKIVDDLNEEDMRGIHIIKSQVLIDTDNPFMIGMECLASEERGILLRLTLMIHIIAYAFIHVKFHCISKRYRNIPYSIRGYFNLTLKKN